MLQELSSEAGEGSRRVMGKCQGQIEEDQLGIIGRPA